MQKEIPPQRTLPNAKRDPLLDLPRKEEEPCDEPLEEICIEIVGQPLEKGDYEICERERENTIKLRCRLCWWALLILLVYLLSEYYFKRLVTVY